MREGAVHMGEYSLSATQATDLVLTPDYCPMHVMQTNMSSPQPSSRLVTALPWMKPGNNIVPVAAAPVISVLVMVAGLLLLGSFTGNSAQAHVRPCVTLKGTALKSELDGVLGSSHSLSWQCLRIIGNDSLEEIHLPYLPKLTYLEIKGNKNLKAIEFPEQSNLKYLYIDDNDDDLLRYIDFSKLTKLVHLKIKDNKYLERNNSSRRIEFDVSLY